MSAGNSLTVAIVNTQIANDAATQKAYYYQWQRWYNFYNQNYASGAQLSAAGITNGSDQILFQNLDADFNKLITLFGGGTPPAQTNYLFDAEAVAAWKHDGNELKAEFAGVAAQLLDVYLWWLGRYQSWNTNAPQSVLTSAPLSFATADATSITNVTGDFNTLAGVFNNGAAPGSAINMLAHLEAVLGVQG